VAAAVSKWELAARAISPGNITILLVDAVEAPTITEQAGLILTLYGQARERPNDAEEDRVVLNNQLNFNEGSVYWSLLDGVTAVRNSLKTGRVLNPFYTFQFSLPEKSAEWVGQSIGVAAAVLAFTTLMNDTTDIRLSLYMKIRH